uniref:Uncharacterized protein n=1 Tax=Anguilla anguilla TaxID=7936 RepID=A0A0E9TF55_ANGAN
MLPTVCLFVGIARQQLSRLLSYLFLLPI